MTKKLKQTLWNVTQEGILRIQIWLMDLWEAIELLCKSILLRSKAILQTFQMGKPILALYKIAELLWVILRSYLFLCLLVVTGMAVVAGVAPFILIPFVVIMGLLGLIWPDLHTIAEAVFESGPSWDDQWFRYLGYFVLLPGSAAYFVVILFSGLNIKWLEDGSSDY